MPVALALAAMASIAQLPAERYDHVAAFGRPIDETEMASIRGSYIPTVGSDLALASTSAVTLPVIGPQLSSVTAREVVDNWNVDVATPLIAAATSAAVSFAMR